MVEKGELSATGPLRHSYVRSGTVCALTIPDQTLGHAFSIVYYEYVRARRILDSSTMISYFITIRSLSLSLLEPDQSSGSGLQPPPAAAAAAAAALRRPAAPRPRAVRTAGSVRGSTWMESASSSGGQVAAAAAAASPSLRGFCRTCNSARADDGTCNCVCLFCREGRHHSRLCPRRAEHDRFAPPPPPLPPPPAPAEGDAADEKGQGTNKGTTATATTAHHPPPTAPPQQTRAGGGNNSGKEAGKPAPLDAKAGATIGTGAGAGRPRRSPRQRWWRRRPRGSTVYGAQENHRLSLPEALKGLAQPPPLSRRLRAQLRRRLARARRQLRRLRRRGREAGGGLCRCARVVVTRCCCTRPRLAAAPAPAAAA
eukprot:SAG25_NODE_405_length_8429_cov_37.062493_5_plen_369_part_01